MKKQSPGNSLYGQFPGPIYWALIHQLAPVKGPLWNLLYHQLREKLK